jgi:hypothetical protein
VIWTGTILTVVAAGADVSAAPVAAFGAVAGVWASENK